MGEVPKETLRKEIHGLYFIFRVSKTIIVFFFEKILMTNKL